FVRVSKDGGALVRVHAQVTSEDARETAIHVRILSDFIHKSGIVLQKDIVHNETVIKMSSSVAKPPATLFPGDLLGGSRLPDPYVMRGSNVQLNGQFASTKEIVVGSSRRIATYRLAEAHYPESQHGRFLPNIVLVDAFWRFGTVQCLRDKILGVYVPEQCAAMRVYFDYTDFESPEL